MLRRMNNIEHNAVYGLTATLLLDIFAATNKSYLKMNSTMTYGALVLSLGTLLFSLYHTPLRNLVPALARNSLFNKHPHPGVKHDKPKDASAAKNHTDDKQHGSSKTHTRRVSI